MQPDKPSAVASGPRPVLLFTLLLVTSIIAAFAVGYFVGQQQPTNYRYLVRVTAELGNVWLRWSGIAMALLCVYDYNVTAHNGAPVMVNVTADINQSFRTGGSPTWTHSELVFYEIPSLRSQTFPHEIERSGDNYSSASECPALSLTVYAYYVSS